jgi:hypothetical protein
MNWLTGVVIALLLGVLFVVYSRGSFGQGLTILNPRLGIANLGGEQFAAFLKEDRATLTPFFNEVTSSTDGSIPRCDVLFLYARLAPDGSVSGGAESLWHIADTAGATILVVASENRNMPHANTFPRSKASFVFTLDRKGEGFGRFFRELFTLMKAGKPMPVAWATIAPQNPRLMRPDMPDTMYAPGAGVRLK